jgi:hypothetical protein
VPSGNLGFSPIADFPVMWRGTHDSINGFLRAFDDYFLGNL